MLPMFVSLFFSRCLCERLKGKKGHFKTSIHQKLPKEALDFILNMWFKRQRRHIENNHKNTEKLFTFRSRSSEKHKTGDWHSCQIVREPDSREHHLFLFCRCSEAGEMQALSTLLLVDMSQLVVSLLLQKSLGCSVLCPNMFEYKAVWLLQCPNHNIYLTVIIAITYSNCFVFSTCVYLFDV